MEHNTDTVKFGWHLPSFPVDGSSGSAFVDQIAATLERVEPAFDSAWMDDHFIPWAAWQSPETPYLECVSTMAYLAGAFRQIKFASSVFCQSYRNPALLAKTVANLQLLTRGRVIFGIGAGWLEREYGQYNYAFPPPAVRIAQLEETVEIVKALWTQKSATYTGKYYQIHEAYCEPKPDPLPPIVIGGGGEQLTLRVVAKHADHWDLSGASVETYAHKLEVLRHHCEAVGRPFDAIVKGLSTEGVALAASQAEAQRIAAASPYNSGKAIAGTPEEVAAHLQRYVDLGVRYFVVRLLDFPRTEGIELFVQEVMPRLARMS
jgi:alkanesulfonate monooxygenase SsuD/methylene tetrahydromethanopterin reductase-like flavin-dependent oxidoreductase (luciferase family)